MNVIVIAGVALRRYLRDRIALFFVLVLPVLVILIVGVTARGFTSFRVGVVDLGAGQTGRALTRALEREPALEVRRLSSVAAARMAVARAELATAVILPRGMDATLAAGRVATLEVIAEPANSFQQAAATAVRAVVAREGGRVQAAVFAVRAAGGTFFENLARAAASESGLARATVDRQQIDSAASVLPEGFSYSAPTMLVLFVFVNALAGGAAIIETRRLGMYERMAVAPLPASAIVLGETASYVAVALVQSALIVGVGSLLFGVQWGNALGAAALVVLWALVGAGAGMLSGTLFHTPEQASAIGPAIGIAFGMLGGCMWPLSIVSAPMRTIGHVTPQAWAVDAWTALISRGGDVSTISTNLAVLAGFAALFLIIATLRLRRVLSS